MRGTVAVLTALALLTLSLGAFAAGVSMQHADAEARERQREAIEAQRIRCRNGTYWPGVVRQGACSGRGGIAPDNRASERREAP